jgi:Zn ribbon nucleic-acid-binding protein
MKISVNRPCSKCSEPIHYTTLKSYNAAVAKGTVCPSCRTSENNKSLKRNTKKENNPAWCGYHDVPGKVHSKLRREAIKRNIDFELTIQEISDQYEAQNKLCAFTGIPLAFGDGASVDRIDSNRGYNPDNIQIVHKALNMMKKDMTNESFIAWCKLVANHGKE